MDELIKRINELAKKKKSAGLTKEEAKEQIELLQDAFKDAKEYGSIIDVKGFDFDFWEERKSVKKEKVNICNLEYVYNVLYRIISLHYNDKVNIYLDYLKEIKFNEYISFYFKHNK